MTFVIPPEEKAAYYDNARQRASLVIKATHDLINFALSNGYQLERVTESSRKTYGVLAKNARWVLTEPSGTQFFAWDTFGIGRHLNEQLSQSNLLTQ